LRHNRSWLRGFLVIVLFVLLSEATVVFDDYFFGVLGLNPDLTLTLLWVLPAFASFLTTTLGTARKMIIGLSYIPILTVLGPVTHFLAGSFGTSVDYGGLEGLRVTVPIYFVLSAVTIGIGVLAGVVVARAKGGTGAR